MIANYEIDIYILGLLKFVEIIYINSISNWLFPILD